MLSCFYQRCHFKIEYCVVRRDQGGNKWPPNYFATFVSRVVVFSDSDFRLKYLTPEALNVTLHTVGF